MATLAHMATEGWLQEATTIDLLNVPPADLYGRHVADIVVDGEHSIATLLLESGLAVRSAGKRMQDWCQPGLEEQLAEQGGRRGRLPGGHP